MVTIDDIKEQYINEALAKLPYSFKVFTDTGAYERATKHKNHRKSVINAVMRVTESDISMLGGGLKATAVNISLRFLVPIPDEEIDENGVFSGDYSFVDKFREDLSSVFTTSESIVLKDSYGANYVGAVACGFPIGGEIDFRQIIGGSFEYTCFLEFAYLKDAVNASNVRFYLDDDDTPLPATSFAISRNSTLTANLLTTYQNGQSGVFAENSVFTIDLTLPATSANVSVSSEKIYYHLLGLVNMNTEHKLVIDYEKQKTTLSVIIAKVVDSGEGASNISRQVSFAPLISAEDDDDESGEMI